MTVAVAVSAAPAPATELPPDFEELTLATGLETPTAVDWGPEGQMFIAEKSGRVRVVRADGTLAARPLIDISDHVNDSVDRGLLGLAVDSDFSSNGYLYLLYTRETNRLRYEGPKTSRLTRIRVKPDGSLANPDSPETVLLGRMDTARCPPPSNSADCIPADIPSHSIGTVRSDPDGTLWVGSGDAADWATVNEQAFRAYDETSMAGKILHVDRRGRGLPGHPFCPADRNLDHVCTKVYARGFRNPFRFTLRPGAGPVVGDVGMNSREEVDFVTAGGNYGWPCYEGSIRTPGYDSHQRCAEHYGREGTADAAEAPVHDYPRGEGSAVVAGPRYQGAAYPAAYRGDLFFGDFVQGFIRRLDIGADGAVTAVEDFATGWGGVDLEAAPNGDLVSVEFGGAVRAISYAPGNKTPVPSLRAAPASGPTPLEVAFDATESRDPDGDRLTYRWTFGDGSSATRAKTAHTYRRSGRFVVRLTVSDGRGRSARSSVEVFPGNTRPNAAILDPDAGRTYRAGDVVNLRASATDREDGRLGNSSITWHVVLRHGSHEHDLGRFSGAAARFSTGQDHDADSSFKVTMTATDSGGLSRRRTVSIRPRVVRFALTSSPPGAPVSYAGSAARAPHQRLSAAGFRTSISAAEQFDVGGRSYRFVGWSNGGARLHDVVIPDCDATIQARYEPVGQSVLAPPTDSVAAQPAPPASGAPDLRGPVVHLAWSRRKSRAVRTLRGSATDCGKVTKLQVAVRRPVCRWWLRDLGRVQRRRGNCRRPVWMPARLRRAAHGWSWRLPLGAALPRGRYSLVLRAVDGEGNVSRALADGRRRVDIRVR